MTIITIITEGQKETTTGASLDEALAVLDINRYRNTTFRDETMKKVSKAMSGMVPKYRDTDK